MSDHPDQPLWDLATVLANHIGLKRGTTAAVDSVRVLRALMADRVLAVIAEEAQVQPEEAREYLLAMAEVAAKESP